MYYIFEIFQIKEINHAHVHAYYLCMLLRKAYSYIHCNYTVIYLFIILYLNQIFFRRKNNKEIDTYMACPLFLCTYIKNGIPRCLQ